MLVLAVIFFLEKLSHAAASMDYFSHWKQFFCMTPLGDFFYLLLFLFEKQLFTYYCINVLIVTLAVIKAES